VRQHAFVQVDVFTDRVLSGNALAVVLDGRDLRDEEMQAIALEMNLSETTFLLPVTRPECAARARIFTPRREIPFAGHPTLGTAWVLATRGLLPPGTSRFMLEEGIGPVPVEFEGDPARPSFVWMRHGEPTFGAEVRDRVAMAKALGLTEAHLLPKAPIQSVSTGNPFMFVPLRSVATVDRAALDVPALHDCLGDGGGLGIFVFARHGPGKVYSRMFASHTSGIPEDPATGSASGPLGAYLVRYGLVADGADVKILSEQGVKMGRASQIHIRLDAEGGRATNIRVGGGVVEVLTGELHLP